MVRTRASHEEVLPSDAVYKPCVRSRADFIYLTVSSVTTRHPTQHATAPKEPMWFMRSVGAVREAADLRMDLRTM